MGTKFNVAKKAGLERREIAVPWEEEKFTVRYNRLALTTRFMREARKKEDETEAEPTSRMLLATILDWDLVEEDGKTPWPLTLAAIEELPIKLQGAIMSAIWEDLNPPETPPTPSGSFS